MVFLDAGHGGIIPKGTQKGQYATAPDKMYKHRQGQFHDGSWFFEGVFNRAIVQKVAQKLDKLNFPYLIVSHEWRDTSLWYRVNLANWHHRLIEKGVFVSTHANAFRGNAYDVRGFEIHHFPGSKQGARLSGLLLQQVKSLLGENIQYRPYPFVESTFYVLRKTWMPSILIEHSYFDNYQDARILMDEEIQERFAEAQVRAIIQYHK